MTKGNRHDVLCMFHRMLFWLEAYEKCLCFVYFYGLNMHLDFSYSVDFNVTLFYTNNIFLV
jgi:hypothetical protein